MNENAPILQNELKKFCGQQITKIVYDATDLVFISSSGIRAISFTFNGLGGSPEVEFVNCAQKIYETLEIVGFTKIISFVKDESRKGQTEFMNDKLKSKVKALQQEQLDYFAANNDVVMYQMKLGGEED
jgi:anti-anti-sigma regulatory factor